MTTFPDAQSQSAGAVPQWFAEGKPLGYQQITGVTSSAAVMLTVPIGAKQVKVAVTQPMNYRDDGTAPTSSVGFPVAANTPFYYSGALSAVRFIAEGTTGVINALYYGSGGTKCMTILSADEQRKRHAEAFGVTVNTPFVIIPGLTDRPLSATRLPTDITTYFKAIEKACGRGDG
jgi:hypothetical protein